MSNRDGLWTVLGILGLVLSFFICMTGPRISVATPAPAASPPAAPSGVAPPPAPAAATATGAPPAVAVRAGAEPQAVPPPTDSAGTPGIREALDGMLKGQRIEFGTASALIDADSERVLDALVPVLQRDRTTRIEVAGHTDNTGDADANLRLSARRAAATAEYLAGRGVERGRLEARGYGQTRPIADNGTEAGRHHNRRIEFNVLAPGGQ